MQRNVVVVVVAVALVLAVGCGPSATPGDEKAVAPSGTEGFAEALKKMVSVDIDRSPDGERLTVQFAVMAICDAADVPYQWDKSGTLADPERRQFIEPLHIPGVVAEQAISDILSPVGLKFGLDDNGLYLHRYEGALASA
jgi:hypothetical protein